MSLQSFAFRAQVAVIAATLSASIIALLPAQEPADPPAKAIQDNSFLIEEAYNQEAGVVQHILNVVHTVDRRGGDDARALSFVFTQEWPVFSQAHQFSYTLPYTFLDDGGTQNGIEDVGLNYRFQALDETAAAFVEEPG